MITREKVTLFLVSLVLGIFIGYCLGEGAKWLVYLIYASLMVMHTLR